MCEKTSNILWIRPQFEVVYAKSTCIATANQNDLCSKLSIELITIETVVYLLLAREKKQGRIQGYPSGVRVGRGSDGERYWGFWAGAVRSKCSKTPKSKMGTKRPTDGRTDRHSRV